jgi:hypothetical protein
MFGDEWFINGTYTVTTNTSLFLVSGVNVLCQFGRETKREETSWMGGQGYHKMSQ